LSCWLTNKTYPFCLHSNIQRPLVENTPRKIYGYSINLYRLLEVERRSTQLKLLLWWIRSEVDFWIVVPNLYLKKKGRKCVKQCYCMVCWRRWQIINIWFTSLSIYNYITYVFHWNVTIWLVMKWSHDNTKDVSHPNETQIRTCMCLHDDVRCKQSMV
jgi:hypothetical protein